MPRKSRLYTAFGRSLSLNQWSKEVGIYWVKLKERTEKMPLELALDRFDYFCCRMRVFNEARAKRDQGYPMTDEHGHYWSDRFNVVTVDGRRYGPRNKGKSRPKPVKSVCTVCDTIFWANAATGRVASLCSPACNGLYGAKFAGVSNRLRASVRIWEPPAPVKRCSWEYLGGRKRAYRSCSWCDSLMPIQGPSTLCSDRCRSEANRAGQRKQRHKQRVDGRRDRGKHLKRVRKHGGISEPGITAHKVAIRDGMKCQECGIRVEPHKGKGWQPNGWSIGHIDPISKGGHHTWDNVQCECVECNCTKSAVYSSIEEYLEAQNG